jgi:hypothetical protein
MEGVVLDAEGKYCLLNRDLQNPVMMDYAMDMQGTAAGWL